jgi:hypothetical protein
MSTSRSVAIWHCTALLAYLKFFRRTHLLNPAYSLLCSTHLYMQPQNHLPVVNPMLIAWTSCHFLG